MEFFATSKGCATNLVLYLGKFLTLATGFRGPHMLKAVPRLLGERLWLI
jgi:hypothetical protein